MTLFRVCIQTLRRRTARSLLTIAGLAIGIGALVTLLALAGGLTQSWQDLYRESHVDLVVLNASDPDFVQSRVPERVLAELRALPEVKEADGSLVDMTSYEGIANTFISGRKPGGFLLGRLEILEGRSLDPLPESTPSAAVASPEVEEDLSRPPAPRSPQERQILLGSAFAAGRGKGVGDTVLVEEEPFRVVGVFRAASLFENGGAVVHLAALQRFERRDGELSAIELRLHNPESVPAIIAWLRERHPDLMCQRPSEMMEQSLGLELAQAMAWAVSALSLAVGLVGASNTMLMSVLEQRRTIGILRAIGWRRKRILELIAAEALMLSLAAYLLGLALGIGASGLLSQVDATRNVLQPRVDVVVLAQALVCALALGLLAAIYPAYRAARVSPLEAIAAPR